MEHQDEYPPVLTAAGLGVRTRRGWVFRDLTMAVRLGEVVALCGPAGSGRSTALLALAGRAGPTTGELVVGGAIAAQEIRRRVALARVGEAVELEPDLRVADMVAERRMLGATGRVARYAAVLGVVLQPHERVGDLSPLDAVLFAVVLAAMQRPLIVVVDDLDAGLGPDDRLAAWDAMAQLAAHGPSVVATTTMPAPDADTVLIDALARVS
ncbi:ATP-binding cassette domain-containing protein [Actinomycetes bacterium KLBMP 9759]